MNSTQPPPNAANSLSESKEESLEHPTREMMKPAVVLRPTPTLPSGAAFGLRPQGSAFQPPPLRPTASRSPGIAPMVFPTSMGLLPHLPHPARARSGTSPAQPGPNDSLNSLQTMSEDELAATTVGSLSGRREDVVGPTLVPGNQLARHSVKDGTAGEDSMPRLGGQAQQQALMQQQMMAAYSWQMYMQAAMQNGTAPMPMAAMNGMNVPFMPPMSFMHPEAMAAAYGYPPFDWRRRPREWDSGSRRRRRNENKVCSNCQTTCTPFWRKDRHDGSPLCNACGLYYAKNEAHRPQALWKQDADEQAQPAVAGATSSGTPVGTPPVLPPNLPAGMQPNAATSASMAPLSTLASVPQIARQSSPMNAASSVPISMPATAPVSAQLKLPVSLPVSGQPRVPSGMPIKMMGSMPMGMPNELPVSTQPRAALSSQPRPLISGPYSASAGMQSRMQAGAPTSMQLQLPATASQQFRIPVGAPIGLQPTLPTTTPIGVQYRPLVSAPFSVQPQLPTGAPISMQPRLPVSAPVGVQFRLPGSAALSVQPQLPGSAPISLQSRPSASAHVGVQPTVIPQMPSGAPVGLQFRQPVSAPAGVQLQMPVSAPLPLQHRLPVIAQGGMQLQPPVIAPGSVQTRLPISAPINAQSQLLVSAPVSMQSQMPVSASVKAESLFDGHSQILVNTSGSAQTQALADGPISAAVSTQPHLPPYLLPVDTPSEGEV